MSKFKLYQSIFRNLYAYTIYVFQLKVDTARVETLTKQLAKELETVKVRY